MRMMRLRVAPITTAFCKTFNSLTFAERCQNI